VRAQLLLEKIGGRFSRLSSYWLTRFSIFALGQNVSLGTGLKLYGIPTLSIRSGSRVMIGDRVTLCSKSRYTALGVHHPVILRTLRSESLISVGDGTGISGGTICAAVEVSIGRDCLIGANCMIVDTDFHPKDPRGRRNATTGIDERPVRIGNNVFVGASTIILKGSEIGDDSIIGAGSVVSGRVPRGVIAAGNPCRVLRKLEQS